LRKTDPALRALAVTLDVFPEEGLRTNPRKRAPDERQLPQEASGRAALYDVMSLLKMMQNRTGAY